MSELRWHPLLQEWVITATHRQERTFHPPPEYCPLCPSQPGGYPTEVPEPTYEIVVFENRFPSLLREPPVPAVAPTPFSPVMPSHGVCEVVLYTPDHDATLADLPVERIEQLIRVWRDRYAELGARPEVQYVFIFENKGREIGVTLSHPHGQIYAYPFIPPKIERELDAMRRHHDATGGNLLREIVQLELEDGRRIVRRMDGWVAFVPFFARYPYELDLVPEAARRDLLDLTDAEIAGLARILKDTLQRYDALWGFSMPYVMAQHPRPTDGAEHPYWQFHIEFYPPYRTRDKLKYLAGSESGAGVFINDTLPEETAAALMELDIKPNA
ncbi:MAG: galactose-1-phosphate uridylyltransferase [Fimbriimonadales bacterium]|nr:galactose-1-phosphate uridylyltransferase [Fimbriimonadales bacterium]